MYILTHHAAVCVSPCHALRARAICAHAPASNLPSVCLHAAVCLQIRLDQNGRKLGGREGEYHTPQSQKLVQDKQGTVMQIDLGAAMSQMGDMEREMQSHEGCR